MNGISVVRVELDDEPALAALGRRRGPAGLAGGTLQPPPNVNRRLLHPGPMSRIAAVAVEHGLEDVHLRIIRHRLSTVAGPIDAPLHLALGFRHRGWTVAGPVFVSVLH